LLKERGLDGCFEILLQFVAESQIAISLVLIAVLVAYRRGSLEFSRTRLWTMLALIVAGGAMVVTLFASPTVGERLFFAPAVLFVGGLMVVVEWVIAERAARRFLMITCAVLGLYQAGRMVSVLADGYANNEARMAMLRNAPADTVVKVPPYSLWKRSRYWWGDDFQYASLREYIANEVYDLKGIEYDRPLHWSEPTPHDRYVVARTFDPPLPPTDDAKLQPRYIPTFWEWALVQLRRSVKLGPIGDVQGHKLVHYTVDMVDSPLVDPKHRPIRVFDWTPHKLTFVDGRMFDDPNGEPYVRIWQPSMPADIEDVFVEACGETKRVQLVPDTFEKIGPMVPITLACRGTYTAVVCEPDQCWLAGRYWR
jgi:hypothetical protein